MNRDSIHIIGDKIIPIGILLSWLYSCETIEQLENLYKFVHTRFGRVGHFRIEYKKIISDRFINKLI